MSHQTYKISGVPVLFPCKPYPSQFSMMDRIIKGIERRQNCLLESPTGSGKSLALLCSSLAWLMEEKAKKEQEDQCEIDRGLCTCPCHTGVTLSSKVNSVPVTHKNKVSDTSISNDASSVEGKENGNSVPVTHKHKVSDTNKDVSSVEGKENDVSVIGEEEEDEFHKDLVNFNTKSGEKKNVRKHISISYEDENQGSQSKGNLKNEDQLNSDCLECSCSSNSSFHRKIPKIYFGTRTHKQVAQIVRELRKTEYSEVKMTILGSREHTCIHPSVSKMKSKNEGCKELLNGPGCVFKDKVQRFTSHQVIKGQGLSNAWDLEDLIAVCKPKKVCPYFLSRGLKEEADLVICPYNYLVDPLIREAMSLSLKCHVVILDEAHNIEDSAREAASQTVSQESILAAVKDMEVLMESHCLADYSKLVHVLKGLDKFIEDNKNLLEQKDFNQSYKIWDGFHVVAQMEGFGMGPKHFDNLKKALASIKADSEERKEEAIQQGLNPDTVEMKPATLSLLEQLFMVMDFLYRQEMKYVEDYRASLVHSVSFVPRYEDNQWLNSRKRQGGRNMMQVDVVNLNFWCMNPAVAFSDFSDTRSVILTSGTLSPMASFQSELGLDFKIQLEANHIIKDSQVWVGTLGQGPKGTSLMAVYRNLETFAFQDELGQLVLQVCKTVPHGVLCFLPSYKVLDKLYTRWECTGLLDKMAERKKILREPRSSSKEDFEEQIVRYYQAVEGATDTDDSTDGAIMLAVCRGKISEGLDFADNFARAVISVGIPYPNFKDIQVELKRKYNDQHRHERSLMSGSEWYDIQAFRALNQALGRCIRHRNDWGALIIVDDRFIKNGPKYTKGLSKWVRNKVISYDNYTCGMDSLNEFILSRQKVELDMQSGTSTSPTLTSAESLKKNSNNSNDITSDNCGEKRFQGFERKNPIEVQPTSRDFKYFSIFSMNSPQVSTPPSAKKRDFPKLASIATSTSAILSSVPTPSFNTISTITPAPSMRRPSSHHLPTAVVHPSLVIPPRPLALFSNTDSKPVTENLNTLSHRQRNISSPDQTGGRYGHMTPSDSATVKPIQNSSDKSKISLKIVTEKALPGQRMQVFEISQNLHSVFGGNLNLPVSSTERLVYAIEPPQTPGGNPLARIIKMSEEDKDKIVTCNQRQRQLHQPCQQSSKVVYGSKISSAKLEREKNSNATEKATTTTSNAQSSDISPNPHHSSLGQSKPFSLRETCASQSNSSKIVSGLPAHSVNPSSVIVSKNIHSTSSSCPLVSLNDGTWLTSDKDTNSSPSLFDSPTTIMMTRSPPPVSTVNTDSIVNFPQGRIKETVSIPAGKNRISADPGVGGNKKRSNSLLKFVYLSQNDSSKVKVTHVESSLALSTSVAVQDGELNNDNVCINTTPKTGRRELQQPGTSPFKTEDQVLTLTTRKPLFKVNKNPHQNEAIHDTDDNSILHVEDKDTLSSQGKFKTDDVVNEAKYSNVRLSTSRISVIEDVGGSSPLQSQEEESILMVKRKYGRKRKMSLLKTPNGDVKKCKSKCDANAEMMK